MPIPLMTCVMAAVGVKASSCLAHSILRGEISRGAGVGGKRETYGKGVCG